MRARRCRPLVHRRLRNHLPRPAPLLRSPSVISTKRPSVISTKIICHLDQAPLCHLDQAKRAERSDCLTLDDVQISRLRPSGSARNDKSHLDSAPFCHLDQMKPGMTMIYGAMLRANHCAGAIFVNACISMTTSKMTRSMASKRPHRADFKTVNTMIINHITFYKSAR